MELTKHLRSQDPQCLALVPLSTWGEILKEGVKEVTVPLQSRLGKTNHPVELLRVPAGDTTSGIPTDKTDK